jgi:entericidin B
MMTMKRGMMWGIAVLLALGLAACHTVQGVGRDIEEGGKAIQRATH